MKDWHVAVFIVLVLVGGAFYIGKSIRDHHRFCKANPDSPSCVSQPASSEDETCIITDDCVVDAVIINEMFSDF